MAPLYSVQQVQAHNSSTSCWVIINDRVYDVTSFISDHPGGEEYILDNAGNNITDLMKDELVHLHSEAVYEMLDEFLVGHLDITGLDSRTKIETNINSAVGENDRLLPTDLVADKKRNFLDLTQPLFWQLWNGNYSKAFYLEQVHIPRHVSGSARIFGSPYMEVFTKTPWYIIPIVWLPVVTYNVLQSLNLSLGFDKVFVYFLAGIALWSLVEYTIHRFLFHLDDVLPDSSVFITAHFLLHGIHHYLPMDRLRLVMPPLLAAVISYPLDKLGHAIFVPPQAYAIMAGAYFGYILYDMTHYYLHHANVFKIHFREMKSYHLAHHYKNFEGGYGITSKLWDWVFNTELKLKK